MKCVFVFWMSMLIGLAIAGEAAPLAQDPVVEARLVHISQELRCLVCQNESLSSSRAELADDLRREVRDLIVANKSDQEIKDFLVSRYGDFVLYRPEVKPLTWVLWFGQTTAPRSKALLRGDTAQSHHSVTPKNL